MCKETNKRYLADVRAALLVMVDQIDRGSVTHLDLEERHRTCVGAVPERSITATITFPDVPLKPVPDDGLDGLRRELAECLGGGSTDGLSIGIAECLVLHDILFSYRR